ncbi:hypothetical protein C8A01DRAFT_48707 [Parachaetomium inaequale]|uniref:Uncharacterized protein n=1 Tax=Parachaetomium inaequale TaxID=2588326 RepID=A0AAN6PFG0_9PEZI|nr:hypothetical protein C8A01DRAFT_48707 [Parachaetomium inaequale]
MVTMTVYSEVKRLYSSLQEMVGLRRRKRQLQISESFNFKKETTILPGLTEDEISVLREKAAASRLGIAHADAYTSYTVGTLTPAILPLSSASSSSRMSAAAAAGVGPLSLSPPPPPAPPRLLIPIPIPIPGGINASRHGSGSSASVRSGGSTLGGNGNGMAPVLLPGGVEGMNDLDFLLFGNPSGMGPPPPPHSRVVESRLAMPPVSAAAAASSVGSATAMAISPLELDGVGGGAVDWDMEFDFQLGSPVSPLSPASGGRGRFLGRD